MVVGDVLPNGFVCTVANPDRPARRGPFGRWLAPESGSYELSRELVPGQYVRFSGSTEKSARAKVDAWLADQASRKDLGGLVPVKQRIRTHG
jgi:hypothetical protein